jgi:hypothetical protein
VKRLLIGILLALVVSQSFLPLGTASLQGGENITFRFDDEVSAEDEAYIREGLTLARLYVRHYLDATVDGPLIVNARASSAPTSFNEVAEASDGYITFFTRSAGWYLSSPAYRVEVAVHEFIHVYQRAVLQLQASAVPLWIVEGSAEFLASDALVKRGIITQEEADTYRYWAISEAELNELSSYESQGAFRQADPRVYALSYLGVARIARDRGAAALGDFFEAVSDGADWEDAFSDWFGVSSSSFYNDFENERAGFARPDAPPDPFAEIDPVERRASVEVTDVSRMVLPGDQMLVSGRSDPNVRCISYLWGQALDLAHETTADAGGSIFWLVTIPPETPGQSAELSVDCGAGPVLMNIEIMRRRTERMSQVPSAR